MASKTTTFFILILLIFLFSFSTGEFEDFNTKMNPDHSLNKEYAMDEDSSTDGFQMEMKKLLRIDRPDYDDPVANPKHEPKTPGTGKP